MSELTHTDASGHARMVDVSDKPVTHRLATARGAIAMKAATLDAIRNNTLQKGDAVAVARVAGIMAAKETSHLIPLCHPLPLTDVTVSIAFDDALPGVRVTSSAKTTAQTGVEMEALTAVSVTLLTIWDMVKGIDNELEIRDILLTEKLGGKSGHWVRG